MNTEGSFGESSSKAQENGDVLNNSERPFKKARFAWQVKGKHHLKKDNLDKHVPVIPKPSNSEVEAKEFSDKSDSLVDNDLVGSTEQNLEILGDYLLKQDFNTLESVLNTNDGDLVKSCSSGSNDNTQHGECSSSTGNDTEADSSQNLPNCRCISSLTMVHNHTSFNEDQCIARWQARQVAKAFVDNTINRVLDSWMVSPLPTDNQDRALAHDVAEFINNLPGDYSVENAGILMAISAHGLQNGNMSSDSMEGNTTEDSDLGNNVYPSPPSSPQSSVGNIEIESKDSSENFDTSCSTSNSDTTNNNADIFQENPFKLQRLFPSLEDDGMPALINSSCTDNYSVSNEDFNHFNFMDAAVSFAIQSKGLSSFGSDYG